MEARAHPTAPVAAKPTEIEAFWFWLKLGCISFGGPAGQIAIMHDELVERRRWISERRFLHALNFCMALPGPEAQQLASYIGYSLYGVRGGGMRCDRGCGRLRPLSAATEAGSVRVWSTKHRWSRAGPGASPPATAGSS